MVESTIVVTATGGMREATGASRTLMEGTIGEEKVVATALRAGTQFYLLLDETILSLKSYQKDIKAQDVIYIQVL